jgi:hypothetical protein
MSTQAGWRIQSKPPLTDQSAAEIEVQDRLRDLDELVGRISAANRDKVSISGETSVPDSLRDLRAIVKANHEEVLVAKLLSEPARESRLLKVRDSLRNLEKMLAYHLGVKAN